MIAPDPLYLAGGLTVVGFLAARPFRRRSPVAYFVIEALVFAALTGLMLKAGVVPYRPAVTFPDAPIRLLAGALEIVWWLAGAWLSVGFLRAFVLLGGQRRDSKLVQDLLAALIYLAAGFAIVAYVFDLPLKGLLATSGVAAVIIGLALQSSLGDVFSGIVLNIERPYRVGDWIILDDQVQGRVIETNWRATHILTANRDEAIVPNSLIAKSRLVNCSSPSKSRGASLRIRLEPSLTPGAGLDLLRAVLLSCAHIQRAPEPTVAIKDISKEAIEFEITYMVADLATADLAQTEIFEKIGRAVAAAGAGFAPKLANSAAAGETSRPLATERLLNGVSLFATLTSEEKSELASQMHRKRYKAGQVVVANGTVLQALCIVGYGVLAASTEADGQKVEVARLGPGDYFGETGLLTGESLSGEIVAVTRATIYEISKEALTPLLQARPNLTDELSESLATRRLARRTVLDQQKATHADEGLAARLATRIRSLFPVHS
ncbi:MAG TPA: mechanosensitive ion channel family protein [Caulobacteraceae bacterium]|nr:mechanosensitive ion channel family protein [Caulobacteraceae bacterium]